MTGQQALFQGLAPEESAEHARLLNEYVQALECHKALMAAAHLDRDGQEPRPDTLEMVWLADARIETTRRHLETFRQEHGIP